MSAHFSSADKATTATYPLSLHDALPISDQTSRLTDAHYATFGGEHTKRFGVVPGCCTSWSRRSPRQLRAVGRSLRSGRGALCRSAVRRSDLGPAATQIRRAHV